jgi:hypothetical protein
VLNRTRQRARAGCGAAHNAHCLRIRASKTSMPESFMQVAKEGNRLVRVPVVRAMGNLRSWSRACG